MHALSVPRYMSKPIEIRGDIYNQVGNNGPEPRPEKPFAVTLERFMEVTGSSLEAAETQLGMSWQSGQPAVLDEDELNKIYR